MLRIGVLSPKPQWVKQLSLVFPEWEMNIRQLSGASQALLPGTSNWDALVIDLDALESNSVDMKELVDIAASHTRHMIVLVPPRLQELEAELAGRGLFMLRKPTSSGEIALGLRMLFKDTLSGSSLGPTGDNKKKRDR